MADPSTALLLGRSLATIVLLVVVAGVLLAARPAPAPRRALGVLLLLVAASQSGNVALLTGPGTLAFWQAIAENAGIVSGLAIGAFLALYPVPPPRRSAHAGAVGACCGLIVLGVVLWFLARPSLFGVYPGDTGPTTNRDLLYRLTLAEGRALAVGVLMVLALLRTRALPAREGRAALALLPLVFAGTFIIAGIALWQATAKVLGQPYSLPNVLVFVPGDCCGIGPAVWALGTIIPLVIAWAAFHFRRAPAAALFIVGGYLASLAGFLGLPYPVPPTVVATDLWPALGVLYVLAVYEVFDGPRLSSKGAWAVALVVFGGVFVDVASGIFGAVGSDPFVVAIAMLEALVCAGLAAYFTFPPEQRPFHAVRRAGPAERLGPYRAALRAELASGSPSAQALTKLRPLRVELGVSEEEHAALAYALQSGAEEGAPRGLVAGALFLDRYRVQRPLGEGAQGATWLCRDERVGRDAVLKVLRVGERGPEAAERVLREARALGAVGSPNVVTLYDVQQVGDEVFLVMEHLPGGSLRERLGGGPLGPGEFRRIALGMLRALEAVHGAGLVHRDVKPSNLLLTAGGEVKLADFGVAHLPGLEATLGGAQAVGTVQYMSPEQARGRTATSRSDLYGTAATLYEAVTGQPYLAPRPGEGAGELQVRAMSPGGFRRKVPGPPKLRAWFAKALDPDPAKRFADAGEMREALERALPARPVRA